MSAANHIAEETLIAFAEDPASIDDRSEVEQHLAVCAACWTKLDDFRTLSAAMRDEETWWAAEELATGEGARAVREFAARLEKEDAHAERMLRPVLESHYRFAYANVARRKRFHTGGVVRQLSSAVRRECDRDPRFALALADCACVIADGLPDDYYPAGAVNELRGTAWKEYSTACRFLGQFESGFDALKRAERTYRRLSDSGSQLATVSLCRAALLWEQQRYDGALPLARAAGREFLARRDMKRYAEAQAWEALILHRLGDIAAAGKTYEAMFDLADTVGDAEMKARAAKNAAIAYRDLGDVGTASRFLLIALQLYEGLDLTAMVVHTRWSIARLALTAGNPSEAAQRLPVLVEQMQRLGMVNYAARAQLDLAEALVLLGRFDEVQTVCARLVAFFRQAKMLTGALTAAAYLREAAAKRTLTAQQIEGVREYLTELERAPDLPFAPPPQIN